MIKYYLAVIENGLSFALILSAVWACYRPHHSVQKMRFLRHVLLGSFLIACVNAYVRQVPHLVHRATLTYYTALPFILFALLLLIAFWIFPVPEGSAKKGGRKLKERFHLKSKALPASEDLLTIETALPQAKTERRYERWMPWLLLAYTFFSIQYALPKLLLLTTQVVSYGETLSLTELTLRFGGYILGWIVIAASVYVIYVASMLLEGKLLRIFVTVVMLIDGVQVLNQILLRLYQLKVIPKNRILFSLLARLSNSGILFIYLVMLTLIGVALLLLIFNQKLRGHYENPAQHRKLRAAQRRARRFSAAVLASFILVFITLAVVKTIYEREVPLSPPEDYEMSDGVAHIPIELLKDGHLHRFAYKSEQGYEVRFIALMKSPGNYTVCFDACEICGASGYFDRGDEVICKLCDVVMNRATIGFKGGCNPIPLPFKVEGEYLDVNATDLEVEAQRFR